MHDVRTKWIVHYAIAVHIVWGIVILLQGAQNTAPTWLLSQLLGAYSGWSYLAAGVAALGAAFVVKDRMVGLVMCLPQQMLLLLSAGGSLDCVLRGAYADGVPRPWQFILVDQSPNILVALFHSIALLEVFAWPIWLRPRRQ